VSENPHDLMRAALQSARAANEAADNSANAMASIIKGRLRHVSSWHLQDLKRELRDFNIHTKTWKKGTK